MHAGRTMDAHDVACHGQQGPQGLRGNQWDIEEPTGTCRIVIGILADKARTGQRGGDHRIGRQQEVRTQRTGNVAFGGRNTCRFRGVRTGECGEELSVGAELPVPRQEGWLHGTRALVTHRGAGIEGGLRRRCGTLKAQRTRNGAEDRTVCPAKQPLKQPVLAVADVRGAVGTEVAMIRAVPEPLLGTIVHADVATACVECAGVCRSTKRHKAEPESDDAYAVHGESVARRAPPPAEGKMSG